MTEIFFYFTGLIVSAFILIAILGRKPRSKSARTLMLLVADVILLISESLRHHRREGTAILLYMMFGIINIFAIRKILMGEDPHQETLNAWHDDPANWKAGIFYFNPKDKRIFPPKRVEAFGWTTNFGNPYSILALVLMILFMLLIINISHS